MSLLKNAAEIDDWKTWDLLLSSESWNKHGSSLASHLTNVEWTATSASYLLLPLLKSEMGQRPPNSLRDRDNTTLKMALDNTIEAAELIRKRITD